MIVSRESGHVKWVCRELRGLSSISDPNSLASPVYCWDEEALQNHRTRTGPNRLVVSLWGHDSGEDKAAWPKSIIDTP